MNSSTTGLIAGLLIAVAITTGGFLGFLLAIVLGGGGMLIGRQLAGEIDLGDVFAGRRRE
ncbi:DUF2273 domain-containing protein [Aeromicrobium sp. PE09-221]|uniref:DUF2273 domain-containing protein n=1 Tax=Aeromicrobium sp. PE09-221 TaxID=1898043 RepID=UPI0014825D01|nr:DUF2273 domain-containing protein [Aeromicrobium sp. PE09-221]